ISGNWKATIRGTHVFCFCACSCLACSLLPLGKCVSLANKTASEKTTQLGDKFNLFCISFTTAFGLGLLVYVFLEWIPTTTIHKLAVSLLSVVWWSSGGIASL